MKNYECRFRKFIFLDNKYTPLSSAAVSSQAWHAFVYEDEMLHVNM